MTHQYQRSRLNWILVADFDCCDIAVLDVDNREDENVRYCFNIDIPKNDVFFKKKEACLPFTRSDPICTEDENTREQMNLNSAFIDGGALYGSDPKTAFKLRTFSDGLMKTHRLGPTLPTRGEAGLKGPDTVQYGVQCTVKCTMCSKVYSTVYTVQYSGGFERS